jgi:hypothetical protein
MIRNKEQRILWEYISSKESVKIDRQNMVGPIRIGGDGEIPRHMDCPNYDACLTHAARFRWDSFSCQGCRKTQHGRFEELNFTP